MRAGELKDFIMEKKLIYYGKCKNCGADKIEVIEDFINSNGHISNIIDGAGNHFINHTSDIIYHDCSNNVVGTFVITKIELLDNLDN